MFNSIFLHNIIKIIYVNFHFLPFKQAIKFPIDVYGKLRIGQRSKAVDTFARITGAFTTAVNI